MRRAIHSCLGVVLGVCLLPAAALAQSSMRINAIGMIDFSRTPDFKVGQWVKYRYTGTDAFGVPAEYTMTVAIVGEERFWGDDCFWVETLTEPTDKRSSAILSLMSYQVFKDPDARLVFMDYLRKTVLGVKEDGSPEVQLTAQSGARNTPRGTPESHTYYDTLGTDTTSTPAGLFRTLQVRSKIGSGVTRDARDSTMYTEMRDTRISHLTREIPITGLAREDLTHTVTRRSWLIGRSESATTATLEHAIGATTLIDSGTGYHSSVAPEAWQHSLKEPEAARTRARAHPGAARAPTRRTPPTAPTDR